jgi:transcriptional regulator with XRE-family HTH domain
MDTSSHLEMMGLRLNALRLARKMTLFDLAMDAEVDLGILENIETGKTPPTLDLVMALSDVLKTSPEYLLGLTSDSVPPIVAPKQAAEPEDDLDSVLDNEMGWQARGFIAPNKKEKDLLRNGFHFTIDHPRERVQFYWDVVPWVLSRLRISKLLGDPEF